MSTVQRSENRSEKCFSRNECAQISLNIDFTNVMWKTKKQKNGLFTPRLA